MRGFPAGLSLFIGQSAAADQQRSRGASANNQATAVLVGPEWRGESGMGRESRSKRGREKSAGAGAPRGPRAERPPGIARAPARPGPRGRIDRDALERELARAGLALPAAALEKLWQYHQRLRDRNPELNLTRIHNFENMVRKHYVDSLLVGRILERAGLSAPGPVLDLGTGPGLPGIPLAIAYPEQDFVLADGRKQRTDFVREVIELLELPNAAVHAGRVSANSPVAAGSVITRAVESIPATLDRLREWLPSGGLVLFMKGPNCDEEVAASAADADFELALDEAYTLPHSTDHRRLVAYRRRASASRADARVGAVTRPASDAVIRSPDNARFKLYRSLWIGRNVKKQGLSLLGGRRLVEEALRDFPELCEALLYSAEGPPPGLRLPDSAPEALFFAPELFRELDQSGAGAPLLALRTPELSEFLQSASRPGCVLLLPLGDPENLGAALRSAAAFPPAHIVLLKEAAHPYHPRALRAAAGQSLRLELSLGPSANELGEWAGDLPLFALDAAGEPIDLVSFPERFGLLVGEEGRGLPPGLAARRVAIPINPAVESLNATVAAAIALYALSRRRT